MLVNISVCASVVKGESFTIPLIFPAVPLTNCGFFIIVSSVIFVINYKLIIQKLDFKPARIHFLALSISDISLVSLNYVS